MRCATLSPVMLINRKSDISCMLDILRNLSTFPSQLHEKANRSFATQSRSHEGYLMDLAPPKQSSNPPLNLSTKQYIPVMFVQISECQAPLHKFKAHLAYRRLSGDGSVATPSLSITNSFVTMVGFLIPSMEF